MIGDLTTKVIHRLPVRLQLKLQYFASRFRRNLLGPYAEAVLTNGWNGQLLVSSSDFVVGKVLAFEGRYDQESVELLLAKITPASTVLVVGTHVGALVVPLARKAKRVVGIEANPETYRLLCMNVMLNKLDNVETHNFAAGEKRGTIEFLQNKHNTGGSKALHHSMNRDPLFYYDAPETVVVPMRSLDEELRGEAFDLIVMDIEGSEYFALKGMHAILEKSGILQIEMGAYMIERLGHVTVEDFLALLGRYFSRALVLRQQESEQRTFAGAEFSALAQEIRSHPALTYDVLFLKDASA